jgi:hypothetical protein
MSLKVTKIEHLGGRRSKSRKWLKNQRNRKIRYSDKTEKPNIGYDGWEY